LVDGRWVLGGPAGGVVVTGGAGGAGAVVDTGAVVVGLAVVVLGVAVVVGAPLVAVAVGLVLTIRPGAGSSSAFAIRDGPVGREYECGLAVSWLARLALPATTAPRATATSVALAAELRRGDPFTDGDRTTTGGPPNA
jgi:hypothetical protein